MIDLSNCAYWLRQLRARAAAQASGSPSISHESHCSQGCCQKFMPSHFLLEVRPVGFLWLLNRLAW